MIGKNVFEGEVYRSPAEDTETSVDLSSRDFKLWYTPTPDQGGKCGRHKWIKMLKLCQKVLSIATSECSPKTRADKVDTIPTITIICQMEQSQLSTSLFHLACSQTQYNKSLRKWSGRVVRANETVPNNIWQGKVEGKHQEEASNTVVLENVQG